MTDQTQLEKFITFLQTLPRDTDISVCEGVSAAFEAWTEEAPLVLPGDDPDCEWRSNIDFSDQHFGKNAIGPPQKWDRPTLTLGEV